MKRNTMMPIFAPIFETYPHKGEAMKQMVGADTLENAEKLAREMGEKCIREGGRTVWADGTGEFIRVSMMYVEQEDGGYMPIFAEDGDRVKCERRRIRVRDGEVISEEMLRPSWRTYDSMAGD